MSVSVASRISKGQKRYLPLRFIIALAISLFVVFFVGFLLRVADRELAGQAEKIRAHVSKGTYLYGRGDIRGAINEYKLVLKIDPKSFDAQSHLALCYQAAGDMQRSIDAYNSAISLNPRKVELYINLASQEMKAGLFKNAKMHLQKAVAINPRYPGAHAGLGDLYSIRKNLTGAVSEYQKALSLASGTNYEVTLMNLLGLSYAKLGMKSQAVATFKRALALDPDNVSVKESLREWGK